MSKKLSNSNDDTLNPVRKTCMALYIIYALTAIMSLIPSLALMGAGAALLALIWTYIKRSSSADTIYETHFKWLLRTFWIGNTVYFPIAIVVISILMYFFSDVTVIEDVMRAEQGAEFSPELIEKVLSVYIEKNKTVLMAIGSSCILPVLVWWLYRCSVGFKYAKKSLAVPNVDRWV